MSRTAPEDRPAPITPAVHLEFIQNQAGLPEDAGMHETESYHRALFLHHHAVEMEGFRQQAATHEARLTHLESRLRDVHGRLGDVARLVPADFDGQPDIRPNLPWNVWDRSMFVVAGITIVCLILFGVLNISFNLLESGLVTFVGNPARAYFWTALLPVGALAVKVGWDFIHDSRLRDLYLWGCLTAGLLGVLAWLGAYAAVYPTLSKSTREHIESLSVFSDAATGGNPAAGITPGGAKWIDATLVAAQAIAEIFLSAALGIYMTTLHLRHRPVRLALNPLFAQWEEERLALEEHVRLERLALAHARGHQTRLDNQLAALLAYARSMFQREAAVRHDASRQKRHRLDEILGQLRRQLELVDGAMPIDSGQPSPPVSPGKQIGR